MKPALLFVGAMLLPTAFTAHATSFDCSKAGSFVEHQICADPTLSSLDEDLANVYRQAQAASPQPDALRSAQRAWLREVRNACTDVQCLTQAYRARLNDLIPPTRTAEGGKTGKAPVKAAAGPVRSNSVIVDTAGANPAAQAASASSAEAMTPRSTSDFSFKILEIRKLQRITDNGMLDVKAAAGATLVSVKLSYKNLTAKPIGSMSLPSLVLVSPEGKRVPPRPDASGAYAAVSGLGVTAPSDLGPGLTATDAKVFEVGADLLDKPGWVIVIEADEDVKVPLVLKY